MNDASTRKIEGISPAARADLAQAIYAGLISVGRKVFKKALLYIVTGMVIASLVSWLAFKAGLTSDSTDGATRSGLGLHTDAKTGCQYLSVVGSGITPRMDSNGHHLCGGTK